MGPDCQADVAPTLTTPTVNSQGLVNDQTNRWVLLVNVVNRQTGSTHIVGPARQSGHGSISRSYKSVAEHPCEAEVVACGSPSISAKLLALRVHGVSLIQIEF